MRIISKDLTVQQRDQNKKRRAEKIKQQQKALKEKKNQWTMRITQKI
jgi:FtsZ-binding cell division protein ZapB